MYLFSDNVILRRVRPKLVSRDSVDPHYKVVTFKMKKNVLVVEDNQDIANLVSIHLQDIGAHVDHAADGELGLAMAKEGKYDLVILDLMLPGMNGLDVCRNLRTQKNHTPILMLTAKSTELDRVLGLEIGADDYLTKPFSVPELVARAKAIFRRVDALSENSQAKEKDIITSGELNIIVSKREVQLRGMPVDLTAREFDLLHHFAIHPGQVFTRTQLLDSVWGYSHDGYEHTVNSHINRLRAKIEDDPSKPEFVLTVWGVGYKFTNQVSAS